MRIAKQRHANIVLARPFGMLRDGRHNAFGHAGFRENLQNLAFGEKRVVQREFD